MKKMITVVVTVFLCTVSLDAIPKTCIMYYPKACSPVIHDMQIVFNCPADKRKFVTKFGLMDFFRSPYMPETMKFIAHEKDHFVWECPE